MTSRSSATPSASRCGSPRSRRTTQAAPGPRPASGERDQHGALALAQVVAGRLAGLRPGRRTRRARRRAAGTPHRAAGRSAEHAASSRAVARRPAPRRAAAAARRCTSRSCSGATRSARSTEPPPMRLLEQVEVLPGHQLGAHLVEHRPGRGAAPRPGSPQPASSSSAQARHRSPSRIAPPAPNASAVAAPAAAAVQRREPAVRRGRPRRVSRAVHDVVVDQRAGVQQLERRRRRRRCRSPSGTARRRASPSSRSRAAAACPRQDELADARRLTSPRSSPTASVEVPCRSMKPVRTSARAARQVLGRVHGGQHRLGTPLRRVICGRTCASIQAADGQSAITTIDGLTPAVLRRARDRSASCWPPVAARYSFEFFPPEDRRG